MHADIRSQIKRDIEGHGKADRIMESVEDADMGVQWCQKERVSQKRKRQKKIDLVFEISCQLHSTQK